MPEKDFQREVLDRLIRMETKQDAMIETVGEHTKVINQHSERITKNEEGTKSAHHRVDGIFWGAGVLGGLAGTFVNLIASALSKVGGHG